MTEGWCVYHGRVAVFFVVDPSETVRREAEPCQQQSIYGSAVSEGSTAKKTGQGKTKQTQRTTAGTTPENVTLINRSKGIRNRPVRYPTSVVMQYVTELSPN